MQILAEPKSMAKALRSEMASQGTKLSHGNCLEIVAHQLGYRDWNTLAATSIDDMLLLPKDWSITSNTNDLYYRFGLDPARSGAAMLASRKDIKDMNSAEFAAFMQTVQAKKYVGKRLRLSAFLATKNADSGALWFRVDDKNGNVLRFDNMMNRKENGALVGTNDWVERSIIIDIPENSHALHYGFILNNRGKIWAKEFKLESVENTVSITEMPGQFLSTPKNLGFAVA